MTPKENANHARPLARRHWLLAMHLLAVAFFVVVLLRVNVRGPWTVFRAASFAFGIGIVVAFLVWIAVETAVQFSTRITASGVRQLGLKGALELSWADVEAVRFMGSFLYISGRNTTVRIYLEQFTDPLKAQDRILELLAQADPARWKQQQ